ncbi:4'-phosphopantetheinyl transferase superfamily protein [Streptomyces sp. TS71-3]|uniref:4'-phosphopantetheinyl transferase family protein n=1 Tax=Streptomyces sp. TS71-3 TaxID=2733862 RepID=UPI0020177B16|nr:4'-phosphopantetheinyl transferase superfamily protein [Streptomyces sp. TS71-3]
MIAPSVFRLPSPRSPGAGRADSSAPAAPAAHATPATVPVPAPRTADRTDTAGPRTAVPTPAPGPAPAGASIPGELTLWMLDVLQDADAAAELAPGVLDAGEQKRAADFRFDEHRRAYVAAHVGLRMLLGDRLHVAPGEVEFTREACPTCGKPHGRPAVAGSDLHFSLSHSGSLALVALASVTVGADVEKMPGLKVADQTAEMLHPDETAELAAFPDSERAAAFGRVWTRKEAYLKALGTGLSRGLSLDYVGAGPTPPPGPPGWTLIDVKAPEGYLGALAVRA